MKNIFRAQTLIYSSVLLLAGYPQLAQGAGCPKGHVILRHIKQEIQKLEDANKFDAFHPNNQMDKTTITYEDHNFLGPTITYDIFWDTKNSITKAQFLDLSRNSIRMELNKSMKKMYVWDRMTKTYRCPYQATYEGALDGHVFLLNGKEKPGWTIWDWFTQ